MAGRFGNRQQKIRELARLLGVREAQLPKKLRNTVVAKSRKCAVGTIRVRRYTGVEKNAASKILKKFEANAGGKDQILEVLESTEARDHPWIKKLLLASRDKVKNTSLSRLIAETGIPISTVVTEYTRGVVFLNQQEAITAAAEGMPHAVRELLRMASPNMDLCKTCLGVGKIPTRPDHTTLTMECLACHGLGRVLTAGEKAEFAIRELKELSGMKAQGTPQVQINSVKNTQNNVLLNGAGESLATTLLQMNERLLHGQGVSGPPQIEEETPIDAEVVG